MPAEKKPRRASSAALAHLMNYSTKRSNRHFLRAMLSPSISISISSVNHTSMGHEFDSRTLLAGNQKVGQKSAQKH